ncbi:hypothetical protein lerEdw1_006409 [Lerista edwardsae]|nr:hypothetical protein lerEdw1_006409 [Lerista edwardsae]
MKLLYTPLPLGAPHPARLRCACALPEVAGSGRSEEARGPAAATSRGQGQGDGGGRGGGGERIQPGLGERAAATLGRAGAGDRGGAAERGHGHPGAVQGEAQRAPPGPTRQPVRGLRAEGGVGALRPDPLPHPGGHGAASRGLQLLRSQGLPDGSEPHRLRPRQARGALPDLRADAGAVSGPVMWTERLGGGF